MFAQKFLTSFKRDKRAKAQKVDEVGEQVKKMLQTSNQQLILMVRG